MKHFVIQNGVGGICQFKRCDGECDPSWVQVISINNVIPVFFFFILYHAEHENVYIQAWSCMGGKIQ